VSDKTGENRAAGDGAPSGDRSPAGPSPGTVHAFVARHPGLRAPAGWLSRTVASSSESSLLRRVLGPLRDRVRGVMGVDDVLRVLRALEAGGVPFWVAGGWGVDALAGRQTRSHRDLDIVIDDYDRNLARAIAALAPLGFRLVSSQERRAWMPHNTVLEDGRRRGVDLDSLNWDKLAAEFGPPGSDRDARPQFEQRVFAEGSIGGQATPCLSAEAQSLFHSLFELTAHQQHDVAILCDELGAWIPDPPGD
jgi:lincosamide nucleotidyltransferase A/C/D/E